MKNNFLGNMIVIQNHPMYQSGKFNSSKKKN